MTHQRLLPLFLAVSAMICATTSAQSRSERLSQSLKSLDKKMSSMQADLARSMGELGRARQSLSELNHDRQRGQRRAAQLQERQAKEISALKQELEKCKRELENRLSSAKQKIAKAQGEIRARDRRIEAQQRDRKRSLAKFQEKLHKSISSHAAEVGEMAGEIVRLQEARANDARRVQEALKRNHAELGAILTAVAKQTPRRRRCTPSRNSITRRVREEMARRTKAQQSKALKKINEEE